VKKGSLAKKIQPLGTPMDLSTLMASLGEWPLFFYRSNEVQSGLGINAGFDELQF
jgi:hypothetical protein